MKIPHTQIIIDNGDVASRIPPADVFDVNIVTSMWEITPRLSFKLKDPTGARFAKLNILIGSIVRIAIVDADSSVHNEQVSLDSNLSTNAATASDLQKLESLYWVEPNKKYDFIPTTFIVKDFFNGFEYASPSAGFIQVNCIQSWNFFLERNDRGYRGKISEIIKEVLKNSSKLNGINKENLDDTEYFSSSSDEGRVIRHSAGISDKEFIEKNLIPYLNVQNEPGYFFIDVFGNARLTSLIKLENSNIKGFGYIRGKMRDSETELLSKKIEESGAQFKFPIDSFKCSFGEVDNISSILNFSSFQRVGSYLQGIISVQEDEYFTSERANESFANLVPISRKNFAGAHSSEFNLNPTWYCDDDKISLKVNTEIYEERRVLAEIETGFISNTLKVGDKIELFSPYSDSEESHWLSGSWIIGRIEYKVEKDSTGADIKDSMKITLARRSIPVTKMTSVQYPQILV